MIPRWLSSLFRRKADPPRAGGGDILDIVTGRSHRPPTVRELFAELKNTAYTCATLNASVCAAHPPRLYVTTRAGQARPKCLTRALSSRRRDFLEASAELHVHLKAAVDVEEVQDHPLLTLFRSVNEEHNANDLWELTTLSQEVAGSAYWLLEFDGLGVPIRIWPLASQCVRPVREPGSSHLVDYYEYRQGAQTRRYGPEEVIHFKYPDPRDPYGPGLSPLRTCIDHVLLDAEYTGLKRAKFGNNALPSVLVSPEEVLNEAEARRLEALWNAKFGVSVR